MEDDMKTDEKVPNEKSSYSGRVPVVAALLALFRQTGTQVEIGNAERASGEENVTSPMGFVPSN